MAEAKKFRAVIPHENVLEFGWVRSEDGPQEPMYVRLKLVDLLTYGGVDKNGALLVNANVSLVDHAGQSSGLAFSSVVDDEGELLPQFADMPDDQFFAMMKGYGTTIKTFFAGFGYDPDSKEDVDPAKFMAAIGYGVYLPGLRNEATQHGVKLDPKHNKAHQELAYSKITEFIGKDAFDAHVANGDVPIDNRPRPWATAGNQDAGRARSRGRTAADEGDNGKAADEPTTDETPNRRRRGSATSGQAATGSDLPRTSRRKPGAAADAMS